MRSVLIAGHGYVGGAAAQLFQNAGYVVEGWTKSAESARESKSANYPVRAVDISNRDNVSGTAGDFDILIHCASTRGGDADAYRRVYLEGARNLLGRFPKSLFLFVGSTSVYLQRNGELVTEESSAEPEHATGKVLRETERIVLERGGVVARLGGIYGPGRSYLLQRFLAGEAIIDRQGDRFVNQIHRDDAVSALFLLADNASAVAGQIFNVVDDHPILQSECYRWLAKRLDRTVPPVSESPPSGKRGRSNKRVSNAKLRRLNWLPVFPSFTDAMEKSILPSFGVKIAG